MEAAEANVCCGGLQNDNALQNLESFTGQWRLLSAWHTKAAFITKNWVAAQLKRSAHFVQRNWHRSPHDLQTELNVVPGHWFSPKKENIVGHSCYCYSGTCWMLLLLLLAAQWITNL